MVIHVTVTPMINGEISAAEFTAQHEEKMASFSSFIEFSSSGLKVSSALLRLCDVPRAPA